jgi:hypothetical protein
VGRDSIAVGPNLETSDPGEYLDRIGQVSLKRPGAVGQFLGSGAGPAGRQQGLGVEGRADGVGGVLRTVHVGGGGSWAARCPGTYDAEVREDIVIRTVGHASREVSQRYNHPMVEAHLAASHQVSALVSKAGERT